MLAKPGSLTGRVKFEAEIYVLSKEEGGRHTPFFKNYKPQARGDGRERKRGRDVKREIFERERGCERDGKRERALPQYLQSAGKKRERSPNVNFLQLEHPADLYGLRGYWCALAKFPAAAAERILN